MIKQKQNQYTQLHTLTGTIMTVVVTYQKRTQIIAIDRPHSPNAVDGPTAESLENAFRSFDQDDQYDVAILTGTQGTFCAGAD